MRKLLTASILLALGVLLLVRDTEMYWLAAIDFFSAGYFIGAWLHEEDE